MRTWPVSLVAVWVLFALCAAEPGWASSRIALGSAVPGSLVSDGQEFAAWVTPDGRLRVADKALAVQDFVWPCNAGDVPVSSRRVAAVGAGVIAIDCPPAI